MSIIEPIYHNGTWNLLSEVCVHPLERGYLMGDGVYEIIPCYQGKPLYLADHLERLNNSLRAIGMKNLYNYAQWEALVMQSLQPAKTENNAVYIQLSRGVQMPRDFVIADDIEASVLLYAQGFNPPNEQQVQTGIKAITLQDMRWHRCDIKAITLLGSVLARKEAQDRGCQDAVYMRDGLLTESTASNLFVVIDGTIYTPKLSTNLLAGITRKICLNLLNQSPFTVKEADIPIEQIPKIQSAWLTSSTRELLPISYLDEHKLDTQNAAFTWLYECFQAHKYAH